MIRLRILLLVTLLFSSIAYSGDWQQWRGPFSNGSADEQGLVSDLNDPQNTLWTIDLPGPSAGTPIISNSKVFVTSTDNDSDKLYAICIDEKTGKQIWQKHISNGSEKLPRNNMTSSSPAASGKMVIFTYDNGDMIALDYDGEILWKRNLSRDHGSVSIKFGYSSTPLIHNDRVFVQVLRRPKSYRGPERDDLDSLLLVLDPDNGKTLHKVTRPTNMDDESCDAYSSPIPVEFGSKSEVVVGGANFITGHNPKTGAELWRYGTNPSKKSLQRVIPSSTVGKAGIVFAAQSRSGDLYAIKPGQKATLTDKDLKWTFTDKTTDSPSPLYYKGNLYLLDGTKTQTFRCIDAANGKLVWESKLDVDGSMYASPTAADGKIYCISEKSKAFVIAAGPEFKLISTRDFDEGISRASIAIANKRVFVRTGRKLHCFATK